MDNKKLNEQESLELITQMIQNTKFKMVKNAGTPFLVPRCPHCTEKCKTQVPTPVEIAPGHIVKCHYPKDVYKRQARWRLNELIKEAFDANGIEIPYNQLQVHVKKQI